MRISKIPLMDAVRLLLNHPRQTEEERTTVAHLIRHVMLHKDATMAMRKFAFRVSAQLSGHEVICPTAREIYCFVRELRGYGL